MARFDDELPKELIAMFEELDSNSEQIIGEMCQEGAKVTYKLVKANMSKSFKDTEKLEQGLKMTRVYKTPTDDGINVHIGFYGYVKGSKPTTRHPNGTPIPLIANAREYGTSQGEAKKPFFRKSFKKAEIENAMQKVQDKYIKGD